MKTKYPQAMALCRSLNSNNQHSASFEHALFKLIVLVCLITLASPAWSLTTNQRIVLLEDYVVSLKDRVNTLETANANLAAQVNTLNNQVTSLSGTNTALSDRIVNLESNLNNLSSANGVLTNNIAVLQAENAVVKNQMAVLQGDLGAVKNNSVLALDQKLTLQNGDAVFQGVNVQIVNGMGKTDSTNGKGNLILGYNELNAQTNPLCPSRLRQICNSADKGTLFAYFRSGSHNLVSGVHHAYNSYGGIVTGFANAINAPWSAIGGGAFNMSDGVASSVTGGANNIAYGENASVGGGYKNIAAGIQSSVTGGSYNNAAGRVSSVSGGEQRSTINANEWAAGSLLERF